MSLTKEQKQDLTSSFIGEIENAIESWEGWTLPGFMKEEGINPSDEDLKSFIDEVLELVVIKEPQV